MIIKEKKNQQTTKWGKNFHIHNSIPNYKIKNQQLQEPMVSNCHEAVRNERLVYMWQTGSQKKSLDLLMY